jgi:hypothetical protein
VCSCGSPAREARCTNAAATSPLVSVRRFSHDWERHASLRLRARDPTVIATYDQHGRIRGCDRLGALDAAFTAWVDARAAGQSVVVCASDHATVDAVSRRVRAQRLAAGDVEDAGLQLAGQLLGVGDESSRPATTGCS